MRQDFLQYVWKFSGSPRFEYLQANKDVEIGPSNDILKVSGLTVIQILKISCPRSTTAVSRCCTQVVRRLGLPTVGVSFKYKLGIGDEQFFQS